MHGYSLRNMHGYFPAYYYFGAMILIIVKARCLPISKHYIFNWQIYTFSSIHLYLTLLSSRRTTISFTFNLRKFVSVSCIVYLFPLLSPFWNNYQWIQFEVAKSIYCTRLLVITLSLKCLFGKLVYRRIRSKATYYNTFCAQFPLPNILLPISVRRCHKSIMYSCVNLQISIQDMCSVLYDCKVLILSS